MAVLDLTHLENQPITLEQPLELSSQRLLTKPQIGFCLAVAAAIAAVILGRVLAHRGPQLIVMEQLALGVITLATFATVLFKAAGFARSFDGNVVTFDGEELGHPPTGGWPPFTVIVPTYGEPHMIARIAAALLALDYPAEKLWIGFAVEAKDTATIDAIMAAGLPEHFHTVICPARTPQNKPGACNFALLAGVEAGFGAGLTVIYDIEDQPEPNQLKKFALAFARADPKAVCFQAQLQYENAGQNWLTLHGAAEYALHFGLWLTGLDRLGGPIPLGGTSNAFRTAALLQLAGWDRYNVTEDAHLGVCIARRG